MEVQRRRFIYRSTVFSKIVLATGVFHLHCWSTECYSATRWQICNCPLPSHYL